MNVCSYYLLPNHIRKNQTIHWKRSTITSIKQSLPTADANIKWNCIYHFMSITIQLMKQLLLLLILLYWWSVFPLWVYYYFNWYSLSPYTHTHTHTHTEKKSVTIIYFVYSCLSILCSLFSIYTLPICCICTMGLLYMAVTVSSASGTLSANTWPGYLKLVFETFWYRNASIYTIEITVIYEDNYINYIIVTLYRCTTF